MNFQNNNPNSNEANANPNQPSQTNNITRKLQISQNGNNMNQQNRMALLQKQAAYMKILQNRLYQQQQRGFPQPQQRQSMVQPQNLNSSSIQKPPSTTPVKYTTQQLMLMMRKNALSGNLSSTPNSSSSSTPTGRTFLSSTNPSSSFSSSVSPQSLAMALRRQQLSQSAIAQSVNMSSSSSSFQMNSTLQLQHQSFNKKYDVSARIKAGSKWPKLYNSLKCKVGMYKKEYWKKICSIFSDDDHHNESENENSETSLSSSSSSSSSSSLVKLFVSPERNDLIHIFLGGNTLIIGNIFISPETRFLHSLLHKKKISVSISISDVENYEVFLKIYIPKSVFEKVILLNDFYSQEPPLPADIPVEKENLFQMFRYFMKLKLTMKKEENEKEMLKMKEEEEQRKNQIKEKMKDEEGAEKKAKSTKKKRKPPKKEEEEEENKESLDDDDDELGLFDDLDDEDESDNPLLNAPPKEEKEKKKSNEDDDDDVFLGLDDDDEDDDNVLLKPNKRKRSEFEANEESEDERKRKYRKLNDTEHLFGDDEEENEEEKKTNANKEEEEEEDLESENLFDDDEDAEDDEDLSKYFVEETNDSTFKNTSTTSLKHNENGDDDDEDLFSELLDEGNGNKKEEDIDEEEGGGIAKEKAEELLDIFSEAVDELEGDDDDDDDDDDLNNMDDLTNENEDGEKKKKKKKKVPNSSLYNINGEDEELDDEEEDEEFGEVNYEQPIGSTVTLRPYQSHALNWLLEREREGKKITSQPKLHGMFETLSFLDGTEFYICVSLRIITLDFVPEQPDPKGGILADAMGLGKTVEMISLIVSNRPRLNSSEGDDGFHNLRRSKLTLVIAPLTIINQWKNEIIQKTVPSLRVYVYQGSGRIRDSQRLQTEYDVLITNYQTVGSEYKSLHGLPSKKSKSKKKKKSSNAPKKPSPLFELNFFRVILDEAHNIKNRNAQQSIACTALRAQRRWCLTGTPIQNSINDLFALFRFLKVQPHGHWPWWNRNIGKPFEKDNPKAKKALEGILGKLLLRRTKNRSFRGKKILNLPEKQIITERLKFRKAESLFYNFLFEYTKNKFEQFKSTGNVMDHMANILELLLHLRQVCCHPALVVESYQKKKGNKEALGNFLRLFMTQNGNLYRQILPFLPDVIVEKKHVNISRRMSQEWKSSSKIDALIRRLFDIRKRGGKSVIFSQWTSMLDLVEIALEQSKIKYVRVDGSMQRKDRDLNLQNYKTDPSLEAILISLKVGGLGLNLTCAQVVFLLDPWWNPAVEEQAIDRVHRIGQTRNVTVVRFVVENTVEEKIMELQKTKSDLAESALKDKDKEVGGKDSEKVTTIRKTADLKRERRQKKLEELESIFGDDKKTKSVDEENPFHEEEEEEEESEEEDDDGLW